MLSDLDFGGQAVLVTGAGRGLGAAYARQFAELGAAVLVHDAGVGKDGGGSDGSVAAAVADELASRGTTTAVSTVNLLADGACEALVGQAVTSLGHLDVLVHNAGVVLWEDPQHPSDEIWRQTMEVSAGAGFRLIRAALPHMRAQRYGRIVLTVSGRAARIENAAPGLVAYSAAKMAVYGLMVGFKANLPDCDIHFNAISPAAATRVMVRDAPELTAESIAPGVAVLASRAMKSSGAVLAAAGGRFRLDRWAEGQPVDLGARPAPADVFAAWTRIEDLASGFRLAVVRA